MPSSPSSDNQLRSGTASPTVASARRVRTRALPPPAPGSGLNNPPRRELGAKGLGGGGKGFARQGSPAPLFPVLGHDPHRAAEVGIDDLGRGDQELAAQRLHARILPQQATAATNRAPAGTAAARLTRCAAGPPPPSARPPTGRRRASGAR